MSYLHGELSKGKIIISNLSQVFITFISIYEKIEKEEGGG